MFYTSLPRVRFMRFVCASALVCFVLAVSGYAQTAGPHSYAVELAVNNEKKKSVMTDADITFEADGLRVVPDKTAFSGETRDIKYADIKIADKSYSKKPMLSGGGAIATALLVGFIFALPFLFIKKKKHWMTVQAGEKFAVMQLGDGNFRQIVAEFEAHNVKVNDLKEEKK